MTTKAALQQKAWEHKNPERMILNRTRFRAKRDGVEFNLDINDIVIPKVCPVLGIPLHFNVGGRPGHFPDSPSIDRIHPSNGYTKGNVRIISCRANRLKSDATIAELEAVLKDLHVLYS
jgi:hypothetical protein